MAQCWRRPDGVQPHYSRAVRRSHKVFLRHSQGNPQFE